MFVNVVEYNACSISTCISYGTNASNSLEGEYCYAFFCIRSIITTCVVAILSGCLGILQNESFSSEHFLFVFLILSRVIMTDIRMPLLGWKEFYRWFWIQFCKCPNMVDFLLAEIQKHNLISLVIEFADTRLMVSVYKIYTLSYKSKILGSELASDCSDRSYLADYYHT